MNLADVLHDKSKNIYKLKDGDSIATAATMLTEKKIGALLVEDDNAKLIGIISERDIVGGMGPHGADLHDVRVSELMTPNPVCCKPQDSILDAMAMMTDRHFRHLPVFDGEDLIGLVSLGDLVKHRINEIQAEAEAMRQYIST